LRENPDDPRALGALGASYAVRGNYNFLVRKAWVDALHDATDARNAHKRLCQIEPDNVDARMIPGVYDYVLGSVPVAYRILGFVAGYHGNRHRGIETLQTVAHDGKSNKVDAEVLLTAIYRRERRPEEAIPLLEDLALKFPRNHLFRFEIVQMYSDQGDKDHALVEIAQIWKLHQDNAPGFGDLAPERIHYLEGNFLFWYNDLEQAMDHMKRVTAKAHELDLNTGIMSWMRLGQIYDLEDRHPQAVAAYRKAIAMAPQSEVGKESRSYIARPYRRKRPGDVRVNEKPETRNEKRLDQSSNR
jgi:tetratricopeptide (TPR) repeat protein